MAIVKTFNLGKTIIKINDSHVMSQEEVEKSLERVGEIVARDEIRKIERELREQKQSKENKKVAI